MENRHSISEIISKFVGNVKTPTVTPMRILLLDDDRSFGEIFRRTGEKKGLKVTVCDSVDTLCMHMNCPYDVAIIDYDLGSVTGTEIVKYLAHRAWKIPFVLISQSELPEAEPLPAAGCRFLNKDLGVPELINAIFAAGSSERTNARSQSTLRSGSKGSRP